MRRIPRSFLLLVFLLVSLGARGSMAQDGEDDPRQALEAERARLDALGEPTAEEDVAWARLIKDRIRVLEQRVTTVDARAALEDVEAIQQRREAVTEELATAREQALPESVSLGSVEDLDQFVRAEEEARRQRNDREAELKKLRATENLGRDERAALLERESELAATPEEEEPDEQGRYQLSTRRMEELVTTERIHYLDEASRVWDARQAVLERQLELAELKLAYEAQELALAREEAARIREGLALAELSHAEEEASAAEAESDPLVRFRRRVVAEVSRQTAETRMTATQVEDTRSRAAEQDREMKVLAERRENVEQRLSLQGVDAGDLLRRQYRQTERSHTQIKDRLLPAVYSESDRSHMALAEIYDQIWAVEHPEEPVSPQAQLLKDLPEARHDEARAVFAEVLHSSDGLIAALQSRREGLEELVQEQNDLTDRLIRREELVMDFLAFLRFELLWSRSDDFLLEWRMMETLDTEWPGLSQPLRDPSRPGRLLSQLSEGWRPFGVGFSVLVLVGSIVVRLRRRKQTGNEVVPFLQSIWALGTPLSLYILSVLFDQVAGDDSLLIVLSRFLLAQSIFLGARRLGHLLFGPKGRWFREGESAEIASQVLRSVSVLSAGGQLFLAPMLMLMMEPFGQRVLPRVLEVFWMLTQAAAIANLLRPRLPLIQYGTNPNGLVRRLLTVLAPLAILFLAFCVFIDILGYRLAATLMMRHAVRSTGVILGLVLLHGVLMTLFSRLAVMVARRTSGNSEELVESRTRMLRFLSRVAITLVFVTGFILIHHFWEFGADLERLLTSIRLIELDGETWLTLWDVSLAALFIGVGHFIASNLGLIHDQVLAPLLRPNNRRDRFAFITLTRYITLAVCYTVAMLRLKLSLETIGWVVTAFSVGIGFGLQEIIANFVSGLILLFERPVRVGDIITVGQTGGTVERITIRATVVTNWERQTIIIPNKRFITEDLTNWTHSDALMRRTLNIGVAYGSDVQEVLRILDDTVRGHEGVLEEPPHRIWFDGFGEGSLSFEVWFFSSISDGLRVKTELNSKIYARLEAAGIEMRNTQVLEVARPPRPGN